MAANNKSKKRSSQGDFIVRLIETLAEALVKLIATSASTIVVLGILVILAIIVLKATPEMQQQIIPSLIAILNVIVYHMLVSRRAAPPKPPDAPGSAK